MEDERKDGFTGFASSTPLGSETNPSAPNSTEYHFVGAPYGGEAQTQPQTPPEVHSFTPSTPDYSSAYTTDRPQSESGSYTAPVYAAAASSRQPQRRKHTPVHLGTVIAATLASAILASGITSMVFLYASSVGRRDPAAAVSDTASVSASTVTQINVTGTADTLVEAISEKVTPSVVGVRVTSLVNVGIGFFSSTQNQVGEGSGIIYSSDGYIITNYHVIAQAVENDGTVEVFLSTDTENSLPAEVMGYDVSADLAVLKVNATGLPVIEIGDSDSLKVGQTAVAIGNPGGLQFMGSTSAGVISGLNRTIQLESSGSMKLIQTDAAINPGNSGGALVNAKGQLIGINSAKLSATDYEGMGFAIPVNSAIEICDRIIQKIGEPMSYLGVEISTYYDASLLQRMGYPAGVVVYSVTDGSPAAEVGLQRGDIITAVENVDVTSYAMFNSEKNKYSPGDTIALTVYRQGRTQTVNVTLGTSNAADTASQ